MTAISSWVAVRFDVLRVCATSTIAPGDDPCARPGNWQSPNDVFVAGLPRDPGRIFDLLRAATAGRGNDPNHGVLVYAADALRTGLLPADLRAGLYRALAMLPGLSITAHTTTLDGRPGTTLGITPAGETQEIILNPVTGDFIGERTRLAADRHGIPVG